MATSLLRLGRVCSFKGLQWGCLGRPAAFCSQPGKPTKTPKRAKPSTKTSSADVRAALLSSKTSVAFPVRPPTAVDQAVAIETFSNTASSSAAADKLALPPDGSPEDPDSSSSDSSSSDSSDSEDEEVAVCVKEAPSAAAPKVPAGLLEELLDPASQQPAGGAAGKAVRHRPSAVLEPPETAAPEATEELVEAAPVVSEAAGEAAPVVSEAAGEAAPVVSGAAVEDVAKAEELVEAAPVVSEAGGKDVAKDEELVEDAPVVSEAGGEDAPVVSGAAVEDVAKAEELVEAAPVVSEAGGEDAPVMSEAGREDAPVVSGAAVEEVQAEASEDDAAPPPGPEEPFDISTYKNLQHHSYNTYTFVDLDVEMATYRLPQPSSGRPSPLH